ncbi:FAD-dependent 5-carboxymethylaminomethyl-2-thiouridine(34) oxidoreductase MnmC [Inhella gelatinilytica]|uniref:tRNA 5-methylaminomethyl-2-thiouridine biosynthesis bifunctional protein MnmC n=1 Tax=Inhella gelatinilytica TaxID=2795030 RepID=A0A931J1Q6_9BURK|nr:FAD-dependent 5-carboxymethylaminomethyl-2-thiouridine(34) oxidoreductase MnmC [Inhella gelatinilytica]MBH9553756.1 FAD-dependent 5-carboxymethylaminomethyl-2-thiouridine(34) oxidoreductase MnmC [Inhella gelatinilytica]
MSAPSHPTPPIEPAALDSSDPLHWRSPRFQDGYASRAGALAQAREVFLRGNGLPDRWQHRDRFVILETGFGLGNNFLATWAAWRADPQRSRRLFFLSLERYPLSQPELFAAHAHSELAAEAQALMDAWPPLTPGLHRLDFDDGAVTLLLALGDIQETLPEFRAQVDAFYLDGFAPDRNPDMWDAATLQTLSRLAQPGATAATWSVARATREALTQAGFHVERVAGFGGKAQRLEAHWTPRFVPPRPIAHQPLAPHARRAVVLGAGVAGAACARALRREGLAVTVLDARAAPAQAASGNPGGLFHGSVHPDDGPHARWNRASALRTAQLLAQQRLSWYQPGLLRRAPGQSTADMGGLLARQALSPTYLQALDSEAAKALSGLPLGDPAWFYPAGGALPPPELVAALLEGVEVRVNTAVARIEPHETHWRLFDERGALVDETPLLVLATGHQTPALIAPWEPDLAQRLTPQRGQVSLLPATWAAQGAMPRQPVAGGGYVIGLPDGRVVSGSTAQGHDPDPQCREADSAHNLDVWRRLCGSTVNTAEWAQQLPGRVSWRLLAPDKLPLIGGLPLEAPKHRATQASHWPRRPGLVLCTAMASRGLTWATLAGELAAALALGLPAPVEARLVAAVDPARFRVRQTRKTT